MSPTDTPIETWTIAVDADTSQLQSELRNAASLGRQFSGALIGAFEGIALKGQKVGDVLKSLALKLSDLVLKAAMKPLEQGLGNLFSGLFSAGFGAASGAGGAASALPIPFAKGGVIASPAGFALGGGRMGLMGERGAEAIMPLARGPDGRLGVAASGAARGVNITFNIQTPDAESFRRSETQVAAMLARAVGLGQRNL